MKIMMIVIFMVIFSVSLSFCDALNLDSDLPGSWIYVETKIITMRYEIDEEETLSVAVCKESTYVKENNYPDTIKYYSNGTFSSAMYFDGTVYSIGGNYIISGDTVFTPYMMPVVNEMDTLLLVYGDDALAEYFTTPPMPCEMVCDSAGNCSKRICYRAIKRALYYKEGIAIETLMDGSDGGLKLFPNPTESFISLRIEPTNDISDIKIYNSLGVAVNIQYSRYRNSIKINNLARGLYFARIRTSGRVYTRKFIVR